MLSSRFTFASVLLLFTAIPLEARFNQTEYGDLNSINGYTNCSFYTEAEAGGKEMLHSDRVHDAMNLADQTFGFAGSSPSDQEDGACSDIGSIPRGKDYSFAKEAETVVNHEAWCYWWYGKYVQPPPIFARSRKHPPQPSILHGHSGRADYLVDYIEISATFHTHRKVFPTHFTLGLSCCCLFAVFVITGIYSSVKSQQLRKHKSKTFQKNGGLLLHQHFNASASRGSTPIFTSSELEKTTHCHKKIHAFDPAEDYEVQRLVRDIITLTQINHRNVVKFFGCCLETESPVLVYELVSNGTLFNYIHQRNGRSSFPWDTLLKIASESAAALAYLHSASIIHGNIRSSNILLTDCFTAKVIGFGPSRLVPRNETQISTLVQRTLGYLDPEYLHSGQLTFKSDVYSFGMVLLEIVTGGERPVSFGRPESQRIMASHFVSSRELLVGNLGMQVKEEQVRAVAELAKRCLSLSSADRPAMHEVARELTLLRSRTTT